MRMPRCSHLGRDAVRKRWTYAIQIALALVMVVGLATGCAVPPATSPPSATSSSPASKYPADMSGRVTIAEKVQSGTAVPVPPQEKGAIFWIIDISVRNASYDKAITASVDTGYKGWELVSGNNVYRPVSSGSFRDTASIPPGGSGHVMLYFTVPSTLQISDAKICYRGQEPYSYGKLSGVDKVVAYDWYLKKVVATPETLVETYLVYKGPLTGSYTTQLRTIQRWTGNGNRVLDFSADKSPVVINFGYTPTSRIKSSLDISFQGPAGSYYPQVGSNFWRVVMNNGEILEGTGRYVITVTASGCDWWIKVGVEQ